MISAPKLVNSKPIDISDCIGGDPGIPKEYANLRIKGGKNSLCFTRVSGIDIHNLDLGAPKGVPGDSNHSLLLDTCCNVNGAGLTLRAAGSDAVNLFNCKFCRLRGLKILGAFFDGTEKKSRGDIGRAVVIDGTGTGGQNVTIDHSHIPHLTVAAGGNIILGPNLVVDGPIQLGGGYGEDLSREPGISVYLVGVTAPLLFVHPLSGRIEIEQNTCNFKTIDDKGNRICPVRRMR